MQCLFNRTNDCICASSRNEGTVFNDGIFRMDGPAAVQMDGVDLRSVQLQRNSVAGSHGAEDKTRYFVYFYDAAGGCLTVCKLIQIKRQAAGIVVNDVGCGFISCKQRTRTDKKREAK